MEDIVPKLVEAVTKDFHNSYNNSNKIQQLLKKVKERTATYAEAQDYALEVSRLIGKAYEKNISTTELPNGRMYYNIASRLIPATLDENYELVSNYAASVQKSLNEKARIGLKEQVPEINQDRIDGLVDMASNAEHYDEVAEKLLTKMESFSQNIVDETIKANVNLHGAAGLSPRIIRKAEHKCCEWCSRLAGVHSYPTIDNEVFKRHGNCRCTVDYDPGDARRQNAHTKRLTTPEDRDIIEERKRSGLSDLGKFRSKEYQSTVSTYVKVDRDSVVKTAQEGKKHGHGGVFMDAKNKSKKELQKSIISHVAQVERHAEKIQHPEKYVLDWEKKDSRYQQGLLKKWEKDMRRNAEQAEIEIAVFDERYGQ